MDVDDIAQYIRSTRKSKGLSQAQLAERAGIGRRTITALENNQVSEIGLKKVRRVLHVLGLDLIVAPRARTRPTLGMLIDEEDRDQDTG